jgi:hypothetical protein
VQGMMKIDDRDKDNNTFFTVKTPAKADLLQFHQYSINNNGQSTQCLHIAVVAVGVIDRLHLYS